MDVINCGDKSLPRSTDVPVTVSMSQTERATDLTIACLVTSTGQLPIGPGRVKFYTSAADVMDEWGSDSEAYKFARDFFSQSEHPEKIAIAQAFSVAQAGYMTCGQGGALESFTSIEDGSFSVAIDSITYDVTGCDFSDAGDFAAVCLVIQSAITSAGGAASVTHDGTKFTFTSALSGDGSSVSVLSSVGSGSDISGFGILNGQEGTGIPQAGYTPTGIDGEINLIQQAAGCTKEYIYAWILEKSYRDSADVLTAAAYIETIDKAIHLTTSNDPQAKNSASVNDVGALLTPLAYEKTCAIWMQDSEYYPDAAIIAQMLSVNYSGENTTKTAKFKNLVGIPTQGVETSDLLVLQNKRYNLFTAVGNSSRTFRDGIMISESYYIDDRINLDNLVEQLQTAEYNVFLKNNKIFYSDGAMGEGKMIAAATRVCERFKRNGSLNDRAVEDFESDSGIALEPAYSVSMLSTATASASDRAERLAPPMQIGVYLAGAIHKLPITLSVYN